MPTCLAMSIFLLDNVEVVITENMYAHGLNKIGSNVATVSSKATVKRKKQSRWMYR